MYFQLGQRRLHGIAGMLMISRQRHYGSVKGSKTHSRGGRLHCVLLNELNSNQPNISQARPELFINKQRGMEQIPQTKDTLAQQCTKEDTAADKHSRWHQISESNRLRMDLNPTKFNYGHKMPAMTTTRHFFNSSISVQCAKVQKT